MFNLKDPISDMFNRICTAQISKFKYVYISFSKIKFSIIKVLKYKKYIINFFVFKYNDYKKIIVINLKYYNTKPAINNIKRVSKCSLRIYKKNKNIPIIMNGLALLIISTTLGVISGDEAYNLGVGGEIICYVF